MWLCGCDIIFFSISSVPILMWYVVCFVMVPEVEGSRAHLALGLDHIALLVRARPVLVA
jgi:hypothetical protein